MTSFPYRLTTGLAALAACIAFTSCANTTKSPDTGVVDYTQPKSKLSHEEYPFDDAGNYREDWAAAGAGTTGVKDKPTDTAMYKQPSDSGPQSHPAYTPDEPPARSTTTASRSSSTTHRTTSSSSRSTASHSSSRPKPKSKPAPPKPTMVKVKPGDTLYALSKRSGVSVEAIKAANGLKSDTIVDGKSLKIPKKK